MDDIKISKSYSLPKEMKAWVLKSPNELELKTKAIPTPSYSEVLVKIDAVAICATDLDCLLYTSPSPRDRLKSRMPSSA